MTVWGILGPAKSCSFFHCTMLYGILRVHRSWQWFLRDQKGQGEKKSILLDNLSVMYASSQARTHEQRRSEVLIYSSSCGSHSIRPPNDNKLPLHSTCQIDKHHADHSIFVSSTACSSASWNIGTRRSLHLLLLQCGISREHPFPERGTRRCSGSSIAAGTLFRIMYLLLSKTVGSIYLRTNRTLSDHSYYCSSQYFDSPFFYAITFTTTVNFPNALVFLGSPCRLFRKWKAMYRRYRWICALLWQFDLLFGW